ncbi:MAG: ferritin-like domain-containing protein [Planctomycetota bacterium]|jgi:rubrerythrin
MVNFNAFQVLQIAEQIERNASKFYREVAELLDEPGLRKVLFDLADWEAEHEETFENMRKQLSEQSRELRAFDLDELQPSPKAMAGLAVFGPESNPIQEFTGKEKRTEILTMAIEKEKDTITYYKGLKDFVLPQNGQDKLDDIIEEEWKHIKILEQSLKLAIVGELS